MTRDDLLRDYLADVDARLSHWIADGGHVDARLLDELRTDFVLPALELLPKEDR